MKNYRKRWQHLHELIENKKPTIETFIRVTNALYTRKEIHYGSLLYKHTDIEPIKASIRENKLIITITSKR